VLISGCPRCGSDRWTTHDRRSRRLFEFEGETIICQQRWRCVSCRKVVTVFDDRVVPRHLYAQAVIVRGLMP
jgi:transposase-like protein